MYIYIYKKKYKKKTLYIYIYMYIHIHIYGQQVARVSRLIPSDFTIVSLPNQTKPNQTNLWWDPRGSFGGIVGASFNNLFYFDSLFV